MNITDQMVDAAMGQLADFSNVMRTEMRAALTAALAVSGYGEAVEALRDRINMRMNDHLCEMKPDYDDSIVGFNEAWTIARDAFADVVSCKPASAPRLPTNTSTTRDIVSQGN